MAGETERFGSSAGGASVSVACEPIPAGAEVERSGGAEVCERSTLEESDGVGFDTVVERETLTFVVSVEGGGGRPERVETRHRKHSPFPK